MLLWTLLVEPLEPPALRPVIKVVHARYNYFN
jgi:hypothetical protein